MKRSFSISLIGLTRLSIVAALGVMIWQNHQRIQHDALIAESLSESLNARGEAIQKSLDDLNHMVDRLDSEASRIHDSLESVIIPPPKPEFTSSLYAPKAQSRLATDTSTYEVEDLLKKVVKEIEDMRVIPLRVRISQ